MHLVEQCDRKHLPMPQNNFLPLSTSAVLPTDLFSGWKSWKASNQPVLDSSVSVQSSVDLQARAAVESIAGSPQIL